MAPNPANLFMKYPPVAATMGLAIAIARRDPPPVVGHIGWAVELPDGTYFAGATENPGGFPHLAPGQNNGAWTFRYPHKDAMLSAFAGGLPGNPPTYTWWKEYNVPRPNPDAACRTGTANAGKGYAVIGNNCLDHATDVLAAYGVPWQAVGGHPPDGMPWKQTAPAPAAWLNAWNRPLHTFG